jgi:hypothetical protein
MENRVLYTRKLPLYTGHGVARCDYIPLLATWHIMIIQLGRLEIAGSADREGEKCRVQLSSPRRLTWRNNSWSFLAPMAKRRKSRLASIDSL